MKKTMRAFHDAGVLEYQEKRMRFKRDSQLIEKLLQNKLDLSKQKSVGEENTFKINELINEARK